MTEWSPEESRRKRTLWNRASLQPLTAVLCNGPFDASVAVQPEAGRRRHVGNRATAQHGTHWCQFARRYKV